MYKKSNANEVYPMKAVNTMNKMMHKIDFSRVFLLSDMDGTLINSRAEISDVNKAVLREFTAAGGTFAVATGRTLGSCKSYIDELPINAPSIFYNGTLLENVRTGTVLKTLSLSDAAVYDFIELCLSRCPGICVQLHTKDVFYIVTDAKWDDPVLAREKPYFIRTTLSEMRRMGLPVLKVQFYTEDKSKIDWLGRFASSMQMDKNAKYFSSWSCYFEMIPKNASKGIMLEQLRRMPMYKDKIFIAMGDFDNDIEMLLSADWGIAAQNATDRLKRAADIVSVSCDDHLPAHVITKILPHLSDLDSMDKLLIDNLLIA